jgi:predicted small lipoprotein YifL
MRSTHSLACGAAFRGALAALLLGLVALTCTACGQRGPLFLPDAAPAADRGAAASDETPPETADGDEEKSRDTDDEKRE